MEFISYDEFKKLDIYNDFINVNPDMGILKIEAFIANEGLPIPDTDILIYYRKKQAENKHFKECITACSTKLLRIIFAMCKNNSLYVQR